MTPSPTPHRHTSSQEALAADYVTFTSASTVRFFLQAAGGGRRAEDAHEVAPSGGDAGSPGTDLRTGLAPGTRIVSIGPITSDALRERGLAPHVEAAFHDIDGLVQALSADVAARPR